MCLARTRTRVHGRTDSADGITAPERARPRVLLDIGKPLGSGTVARSAALGETRADGGGEVFAKEGTKDRKAGAEDANVAFDVEPDTGIDNCVYTGSVTCCDNFRKNRS